MQRWWKAFSYLSFIFSLLHWFPRAGKVDIFQPYKRDKLCRTSKKYPAMAQPNLCHTFKWWPIYSSPSMKSFSLFYSSRQLFHPKLSEPRIPVHQNKQALLHFWYSATVDCPDNVKLILTNPHVVKNIAFNYILADHEDSDVVNFNRTMLPTYYGLLRLCCTTSR